MKNPQASLEYLRGEMKRLRAIHEALAMRDLAGNPKARRALQDCDHRMRYYLLQIENTKAEAILPTRLRQTS